MAPPMFRIEKIRGIQQRKLRRVVSGIGGKPTEGSVPETKRRKYFKKERIISYVICCWNFEQIVVN